jgi:hypothetical protein
MKPRQLTCSAGLALRYGNINTTSGRLNVKRSAAIPKAKTFRCEESSNLEGGSYVDGTAVLAFRDKKREGSQVVFYSYEGVTQEDWDRLVLGERKYFKAKYKGTKIPS